MDASGVVTLCDKVQGMQLKEPQILAERMRQEVNGAANTPWGLVQKNLLDQVDTKGELDQEIALTSFRERVILPLVEALEKGFVESQLQFDFEILQKLLDQTCPFLEWGFRGFCSGDLPGPAESNHYDSDRVTIVKTAIEKQLQNRKRETNAAEMDCE